MTSESHIQDQILLALGSLPHVRLHRQQAGRVAVIGWEHVDRARRAGIHVRTLQLAPAGAADLAGVVQEPCTTCGEPIGRSLQVEVKSAAGRLSDDQIRYHAVYRKLGALVITARSAADALDQLCPMRPPRLTPNP